MDRMTREEIEKLTISLTDAAPMYHAQLRALRDLALQALDRDAVLEEAALHLDNIGWAAEPDRAEKASWCRAAKSVRDLKKKEITNDPPITLTRHSLKGDDLLGYAMCEDPNGKWVPYEQSVTLRALKREPSAEVE